MQRFLLLTLGLIVLLAPPAGAKEQQQLRERVRDGVMRSDKDLESLVSPDKLNAEDRGHFDAAVKDLRELQDAVGSDRWQGERDLLERAADNIDALSKHAAISDGDKQTLGIDVYTLRTILDAWTKP